MLANLALFFHLRYDYENVDIDAACDMMEDLESMISEKSFIKQRFAVEDKIFQVEKADSFEYTDPVDSSITRHQVPDTHWAERIRACLPNRFCPGLFSLQGLRIIFTGGSRVIYRLSGTDTVGATVRIYIDSYEKEEIFEDTQVRYLKIGI